MRNGQSHPQLLTLTSPAPNQTGMPHFSRPLREVGTTSARSAALDVDVAFARVERTLLSVAFDLDVDLLLAPPQALSFRPQPGPERSRRGRRSGGTRCQPAPPQLMERRTPRPSAEQSDAPGKNKCPAPPGSRQKPPLTCNRRLHQPRGKKAWLRDLPSHFPSRARVAKACRKGYPNENCHSKALARCPICTSHRI
jgi:hypothetical protein